jgi:hypothetical protein
MLKYYLIENKLSPDSDYYTARVVQQEVASFDEVVRQTTRRGVTITDTELTGAINELTYTIVDLLNSGKIVETPFARFKPSIGGVFTNQNDAFDAIRHTVKIYALPGKVLKLIRLTLFLRK